MKNRQTRLGGGNMTALFVHVSRSWTFVWVSVVRCRLYDGRWSRFDYVVRGISASVPVVFPLHSCNLFYRKRYMPAANYLSAADPNLLSPSHRLKSRHTSRSRVTALLCTVISHNLNMLHIGGRSHTIRRAVSRLEPYKAFLGLSPWDQLLHRR